MIIFNNVSKNYGDHKALVDVSFELQGNQVVGLLGPNGAGKTTCMKLLSGAMGRSAGGYKFLEESIEKDIGHSWKKKIGYLPERPPVYEDLSVKENLEFWADLKAITKNERKSEVERVVARCGLEDVLKRRGAVLSKGYRQRLGIASAILGNPDVLILDEPVSGLDPKQMIEIRNLVKELGEDHLVIFSSHQLHEVEQICSSFLFLNKGHLIAKGKKEEIQPKLKLPLLKIKFFEAPEELPEQYQWQKMSKNEYAVAIKKSHEAALELQVSLLSKNISYESFQWQDQNLESVFLSLIDGDSTE